MTWTDRFGDLGTRVISALVLIVVAGLALWFGGYAWTALVTIAAGIMAWEAHALVPKNPDRTDAGLAVASITAGASVVLTNSLGLATGLIAPLAGVLMLGAIDSNRYLRLALGIYAVAMASVGLVALRNTGPGDHGLWLTAWLILAVVAADVGAYFAGRIFGGPKLWPAVSPNKTWSGVIGGWVLAILVSALFAWWMGWDMPRMMMLAVAVALASQAGDLAESAVKRGAGVKDTGTLIPGHGGFLDRFDALMGASLFATIAGLASYIR
jgi:phosphatidate cytidylyltransferase